MKKVYKNYQEAYIVLLFCSYKHLNLDDNYFMF